MFFRMDSLYFGLQKDILLVFVYIPSEKSSFYKNREENNGVIEFEQILVDKICSNADCDLFLAGDFNSRTSENPDYINDDISFLPNVDWYDSDNFDLPRKSLDKNGPVNNHGLALLELCKTLGVHFLNGRFIDDSSGHYTYCSPTGNSVVDYMLASTSLFNQISNFKVDTPDQSDHFPITCVLNYITPVPDQDEVQDDNVTHPYVKYRWDPAKGDHFLELLQNEHTEHLLHDFNDQLSHNMIDEAVHILEIILQDAACDMKNNTTLSKHKHDKPQRLHNNTVWWDDECERLKRNKNHLLNSYRKHKTELSLNAYIACKQHYKKLCRAKELNHKKSMLNQLECVKNNTKELWTFVNSCKPRNCISQEITPNDWLTHFKNLFKENTATNEHFDNYVCDFLKDHDVQCDTCTDNDPNLDVLNANITVDEIKHVVSNLKHGKSPGLDGLPYEMYFNAIDVLANPLQKLFNSILESGFFPESWSKAIISPLHKKGSKKIADNYRGISLLCCVGKIFTKILNNRLVLWSDQNDKLNEGQGAYRAGRSTSDHIFTLYSLIQKYLCKKGGRFYVAFIDFSKAFDSIPHANLWFRLIKEGIHGKLLSVLRSMYSKLKACVKTSNGLSDFFQCVIGTRQGCMVSPFLFILYIDELISMCNLQQCQGLFLNEIHSNVHMLMYADDIAIFNDTVGRLQTQLNVLSEFCSKYQLKFNLSKTKVVVFRNGGCLRKNEKWFFDGKEVEAVTYYKYLGMFFSSSIKWSYPLKVLSQQATKAMYVIYKMKHKCSVLPLDVAFNLFDKMVLPVLLYGSEVWGTEYRKDIEQVQINFCKYVLCVPSKTPNSACLGECGRKPLYVLYLTRCIKYWLRLVQDLTADRYPKCCYNLLYSMQNSGYNTWAKSVKTVLYLYGFGHVWLNQSVGNADEFLLVFKQRISDISSQEWSDCLSNTSKLSAYSQFKSLLEPEKYINSIPYVRHRIALTRLRCSCHRLAVERLRGTLERENRLCSYCLNNNVNRIEDEYHFVLVCPLYNNLRQMFLPLYVNDPSIDKFNRLMSSQNESTMLNLSKYVHAAFKIHKHFMGL